MKMLKLVSLFAVVCILMVCVAGTAFAAGSKSDWVEITSPDELTVEPKQDGDPLLTREIAARKIGCPVLEVVLWGQWNAHAPKLPISLTFKTTLKANQKGYVFHWNGNDWDLMGQVNTSIVFNSLSPVGVAIRQLSPAPTPTPAPGGETSPATGVDSLPVALALAAIVMGGAAAFISTKKKS